MLGRGRGLRFQSFKVMLVKEEEERIKISERQSVDI